MTNPRTDRITVTLTVDRIESLKKEALSKGLSLPTFCRVLLSETADEFTANRKAKAA